MLKIKLDQNKWTPGKALAMGAFVILLNVGIFAGLFALVCWIVKAIFFGQEGA